MTTPLSNNPGQVSSNTYTTPDGLMYTSSLANSANCLFAYIENISAPFTFTKTKGDATGPSAFNSIVEVLAFQAKTPGTLIIFQDGTADWNFDA